MRITIFVYLICLAMKEKILKFLLVLLGFGAAACEEKNLGAYGCPTVALSLKARVTDNANRPVKGIRAQAASYTAYYGSEYYEFDSKGESYSDSDGNTVIEAKIYSFDAPPYSIKVGFEDIDGAENGGEFTPKEVEVQVTESDKISSGAWIKSYSADLGNIVLDEDAETGN